MPVISIIIPIYNVERYLSRLMELLLAQVIGLDIEIILVDDCSTDRSAEIAENYAKQSPDVITFHRMPENGGVSLARNFGKSIANGTYLWFVDSDDVVLPYAVRALMDAIQCLHASSPDIIAFDSVTFVSEDDECFKHAVARLENERPQFNLIRMQSEEEFSQGFVRHIGTLIGWNALYRRETVKVLDFSEYPNGEDILWGNSALMLSKSIVVTSSVLYGYFTRPGSALQTISVRHLRSAMSVNRDFAHLMVKFSLNSFCIKRARRKIFSDVFGCNFLMAKTLGHEGFSVWHDLSIETLEIRAIFPLFPFGFFLLIVRSRCLFLSYLFGYLPCCVLVKLKRVFRKLRKAKRSKITGV